MFNLSDAVLIFIFMTSFCISLNYYLFHFGLVNQSVVDDREGDRKNLKKKTATDDDKLKKTTNITTSHIFDFTGIHSPKIASKLKVRLA